MEPRSVAASDPAAPVGMSPAELLEEIAAAIEAGEPIDIEAYLQRAPQHAEQLRTLVPMLLVLDEMDPSAAASSADSDDAATLAGSITRPASAVSAPGHDRRSRDGAEARGVLGDFRILREVGRGGMGIVYEAEQLSLGRRVALKVLPLAGMLDRRRLQRFQNEARAAAGLHHPHIVPVHSVGCERGVHYYAMQFIEGQSLAEVFAALRRRSGDDAREPTEADRRAEQLVDGSLLKGSLKTTEGGAPGSASRAGASATPDPSRQEGTAAASAETSAAARAEASVDTRRESAFSDAASTRGQPYYRTVAQLGAQAAEALEYAHSLGVVHRDIKPANLLLDEQGKVWVADFGLAQIESDAGLTATGDVLGTVRYMSPEQAMGRAGGVDHRTDIYSLGITLYELVTLRAAFGASDRRQVLRQVLEDDPTPPRQIDAAIPRDLETILLKAISKEPRARYATAQELADDLRRYLELKPIQARRPTLVDRSGKWLRRHPAVTAAAIAILLATTTALGVSTVLVSRAFEQEGKERQRAETAMSQEAALRQEAERLRVAAEDNFQDALAAVKQMLVHVSEQRLLHLPQMQQVRSELMTDAADFYNRLVARRPQDRTARFEAAQAFNFLGYLRYQLQEGEESEQNFRRALELLEGSAQIDGPKTADEYLLEESIHRRLALNLRNLDRFDECLECFHASIRTARELVDDYPHAPRHREVLSVAIASLADYYTYSNAHRDPQLAERYARESLEVAPAERAYRAMARVYRDRGEYDEARNFLIQAIDHPDADLWTFAELANVERNAGQQDAELINHQKAYQLMKEHLLKTPGEFTVILQWERTVTSLFQILKRKGKNEFRELALDILTFTDACLTGPMATAIPDETRNAFNRVEREILLVHLDPADAVEQGRAALQKRPTDAMRLIFARALLRNGDQEEARSVLEAVSEEPDDPHDLIEMGELAATFGNTDLAAVRFRRALEALQDQIHRQPSRGDFAEKWKASAESVLELLRTANLDDEHDRLLQQSLSFCEEALAAYGDEPSNRILTAQLWGFRGSAYALRTTVGSLTPDERAGRVVTSYAKAIELAPQLWQEALANLPAVLKSVDPSRRQEVVMKWAEPTNAEGYLARGMLLAELGLVEEAQVDFERSTQFNEPLNAGLLIHRIKFFSRNGFHELALHDCRRLAEMGGMKYAYLLKRYGTAAFYCGHYDEAINALREAIELLPEDVSTLSWIECTDLANCGNEAFLAEYGKLHDLLVSLTPKRAAALVGRGTFLAAIEDDVAAEQDFENALAEFEKVTLEAEPAAQTANQGNAPNVREGAFAFGLAASVYERRGDLAAAHRRRLEAIRLTKRFLDRYPDDVVQQRRLLNHQIQLGAVIADQGSSANAAIRSELPDPDALAATGDQVDYYKLSLVALAVGDLELYRRTCSIMLQRRAEPDAIRLDDVTLWTCSLAPNAMDNYGPLLQIARSLEQQIDENPMMEKAIAAVYYRAGDDGTLERLVKAAESPDTVRSSPAFALYFLAMAQHRAGELDEARRSLGEANQVTETVLADRKRISQNWNYRLTLQLLRDEAETLMNAAAAEHNPSSDREAVAEPAEESVTATDGS